MKNRIIALVVGMLLLLFSSVLAQAPDTLWTRTYGGAQFDAGYSVLQTWDGGYIIAGTTRSFGNGDYDAYIIRTDSIGDTIWTRAYGGVGWDQANSIQPTSDSCYIVAGIIAPTGPGSQYVYLLKVQENGDTLWTRTFEDTLRYGWGASAHETYDGGYFVAGSSCPYGIEDHDVFLIMTDANGDTIWTKTYGGTGADFASSASKTIDSCCIIAGGTDSYGAYDHDVYILKTDYQGDTLWTRLYGGNELDDARSVKQTSDGSYILSGRTWSFGAGGCDMYLLKIDGNGDSLWATTFGSVADDESYSVIEAIDGGFVVLGHMGYAHVYMVKTDNDGQMLWDKTLGGSDQEFGYCIDKTSDGGYIIVGSTYSYGAGGSDVYLIKIGPDVGIQDNENTGRIGKIQVLVSPNPFTGAVNIQLLGVRENPKSDLTIFDAAGRLVKSVKLATNTYELGTDLKPGIYFLKLNGKPVGKVVKVR